MSIIGIIGRMLIFPPDKFEKLIIILEYNYDFDGFTDKFIQAVYGNEFAQYFVAIHIFKWRSVLGAQAYLDEHFGEAYKNGIPLWMDQILVSYDPAIHKTLSESSESSQTDNGETEFEELL